MRNEQGFTEEKEERRKKTAGQRIVGILGVLLCCIFIPVIVFNATLIVKTYTHPDEMPSVLGVSPVIVLSGSMEPAFSAGDMIFIAKEDTYKLQTGDVICFVQLGTTSAVTHRIIEIVEGDGGARSFVTQGDANNVEDRVPVLEEEIQGKYTGIHVPLLGNIAMFMQTTVGMILFIVLPLILFLLWDFLRRAVAGRKNQKSEEGLEQELARLREQVRAQTEGGAGGVVQGAGGVVQGTVQNPGGVVQGTVQNPGGVVQGTVQNPGGVVQNPWNPMEPRE